jgi:Transposase DDE domain group 1
VLQRLYAGSRSARCRQSVARNHLILDVEGRRVEAAFDGGLVTSDAGALLLGATDRAIRMMDRFALCFHDERRLEYIEHEVATLVGQRVFGIALGYEDLNDHDELRHDPMMAILAGKLTARRGDCARVAASRR